MRPTGWAAVLPGRAAIWNQGRGLASSLTTDERPELLDLGKMSKILK